MVSYLLKFVTISQHIIDVEYGDVRGVRRIGVERKECTHVPSLEGAIVGRCNRWKVQSLEQDGVDALPYLSASAPRTRISKL